MSLEWSRMTERWQQQGGGRGFSVFLEWSQEEDVGRHEVLLKNTMLKQICSKWPLTPELIKPISQLANISLSCTQDRASGTTGDRGAADEEESRWESHSCFICHLKVFWQFLAEQSNLLQRKQHGNKQRNQRLLRLLEQTLVLWSFTCSFS